jgi:hypothetical protein
MPQAPVFCTCCSCRFVSERVRSGQRPTAFREIGAYTTSEAASIHCGSHLAGNLRLVAGPTRWIEGVLGRSAPQSKGQRVVLVISNFRSTELGAVPMAARLWLIW